MAEIKTSTTMEEFVTKDRANYYSWITSITVNGKTTYELKGIFFDDLCDNAFSGTNGEDALETQVNGTKAKKDPTNTMFEEWLVSKFANHMMMDPFTREVLRDFWKKVDNNEGVTNKGFCDLEEANNNDEHEIAEIFRIETNLFDYETPLCTRFKEFNHLLKVDTELFTHDIERTKTYADYERELNNEVGEPWSKDGVPYKLCDHICEPFRFKNGKTKWPTCNSNEDRFCNGGELPGMVQVGYMTYFQDYECLSTSLSDTASVSSIVLKLHRAEAHGSLSVFTQGLILSGVKSFGYDISALHLLLLFFVSLGGVDSAVTRDHSFDLGGFAWYYTHAYIEDGVTFIAISSLTFLAKGIAPVAIIDRQLPFEYTITSRSTDVVVMALPVQNINHSAFRSMFEREKLSGNNFNDWFRQLKLVLRVEKKMFVIEQPLPAAPAADSAANVLLEWNAVYDAYNEVACLILGSMTPELHRQFENSSPYDMIKELKAMFEKQAGVERFDLIQTFHACKQEEGKPVAAYVIQMKGYVDQLERLGYVLPQDLIVGLILNGLTKDFSGFVRNYNMHNMGKTVGELHAMLIEYEKGLPKKAETPQVMMIKGGKIQNANKKSLKIKGNVKANSKGKDKQVYIPKPKNPKPSVIEHPGKDDACHHCKEVGHWKRNFHVYLAELLKKKKQVGSASSSVHRLVENGFVQHFTDFGILVSENNVHYFNAILNNGIYKIDMHNLVPNVNSIYNVSTKRAKHNLDSTYLWRCRLAHISKKRIEKLQHEGLLKSTDDESFEQCVSCLSGASYFITFTNDYSRYGYVYLLKYKHEVFETFKVFKNEVENQLGKTIKALRSDRGGEYIIQDFKDYLKACRIVQQLTSPYTPQHNGVSERRNRTLLDMIRSMMNLTTLPLSFWDYDLESATRILNMVPTKKVDKTPYELWYGKVPNLSYLKVWGCEALVKRDTPDKLQQRSAKCIFIGYPKETMGYYFYFPPESKIVVARYGYSKNRKKTVKTGQTRTRDEKECTRAEDLIARKVKSQLQSTLGQPKSTH
ncbi:retrotransposon protein, putative, ty1-copia subclass [Tanacetum coccineum]